jgi:hypothetical protein
MENQQPDENNYLANILLHEPTHPQSRTWSGKIPPPGNPTRSRGASAEKCLALLQQVSIPSSAGTSLFHTRLRDEGFQPKASTAAPWRTVASVRGIQPESNDP